MGADTGRETIKSGGKALSAESAQETSKKLKIVVIGASYARVGQKYHREKLPS